MTSYLFAGLSPADDIDDIVATCRIWLDSGSGDITDAHGCGRLRYCLRARIPPLDR